MNVQPFNAQALTQAISVTSTASTSTALPAQGAVIRVVNIGTKVAYYSIGSGTQTATVPSGTPVATATPILPGEDGTFSIPSDKIYNISAIADSGNTTTLLVQVGEGM